MSEHEKYRDIGREREEREKRKRDGVEGGKRDLTADEAAPDLGVDAAHSCHA